jgi:histone deacetylase 1/2
MGAVERRHRQIVEMGLALLAYANLPKPYWEDAFLTAVYIINRLPTKILNHCSPFEKAYHQKPNYNFMRVFGCACWPNLRPYNKHKFDYRSKTCIFIGYSLSHQGYKCLDLSTGKIFVSRHVIFDELFFPYKSPQSVSLVPESTAITLPANLQPSVSNSLTLLAGDVTNANHVSPHESDLIPATVTTNVISNEVPTPALHAVHTSFADALAPSDIPRKMTTRSQTHSLKPKQPYVGFIKYPLPHALLAQSCHAPVEPTSFTDASKDHKWREAMNMEFTALLQNNTWDLVPAKSNINLVGNKWVYRIKTHANGTVERYKARLVAKGYHQQHGVDFLETFSPVIKQGTIRLVLSIALSQRWCIRQLDIQNAFLHGLLDEEVYMCQPQGYIHPDFPTHICRLKKSLYGLRQAPRSWFSRLTDQLLQYGFVGSKSDPSLYILQTASFQVMVSGWCG